MFKRGCLLLCVLFFAFSTVAGGEGVGALMSSIDNYPEDTAPTPTRQPAAQQADAPNETDPAEDMPSEADQKDADEALLRTTEGDRHKTDLRTALDLMETGAENEAEDERDPKLKPLQIINQIEEPGLIVEALAGSGAHTITVTYMAADEAVGRLDVFAECQNPGVTETWYSDVANMEIGETSVFELPGEGAYDYRLCVVSSDGSGIIVLSISTQ